MLSVLNPENDSITHYFKPVILQWTSANPSSNISQKSDFINWLVASNESLSLCSGMNIGGCNNEVTGLIKAGLNVFSVDSLF